jgi:hypothetical protein
MPCSVDHNRGREIQQRVIRRTTVAAEAFDRRYTGYNITNGPTQVSLLGKIMRMGRAAFGKRIVIPSLRRWSRRGGLLF